MWDQATTTKLLVYCSIVWDQVTTELVVYCSIMWYHATTTELLVYCSIVCDQATTTELFVYLLKLQNPGDHIIFSKPKVSGDFFVVWSVYESQIQISCFGEELFIYMKYSRVYTYMKSSSPKHNL